MYGSLKDISMCYVFAFLSWMLILAWFFLDESNTGRAKGANYFLWIFILFVVLTFYSNVFEPQTQIKWWTVGHLDWNVIS